MTQKISTIIVLQPLIIMLYAVSLHPADFPWDTSIQDVKKTLSSETKYEQFSPSSRKSYRNKLLEYIISLDNTLTDKIIIIRVHEKPVIEYIFVKGKLITFVEKYGKLNAISEKKIRESLIQKFGTPQVQTDKNLTIYSFTDSKTKILYHVLNPQTAQSNCKIFYYAKNLFKKLIMSV